MSGSVADLLDIGDHVHVDCIDGFHVLGRVVDVRDSDTSRLKVLPDCRSQPAFWCHDFEVSPANDVPSDLPYDSRADTLAHIAEVRGRLDAVAKAIRGRQLAHDRSKLADPEKTAFDEYTPKLKDNTYGSDEYRGFLAGMKPALDHHYANNSHHPEHYPDGVRGMCLLDVIEMLADWKAATLRHANGDLRRSIDINQKRFGYGDELKSLLLNTAERMGWL